MKLLKTRIYIDGYNLYYGCLKNTSYKWLDLKQVILKILATVYFGEPEDQFEFELQPLAIKYFTAPIHKNFAKSNDSVPDQIAYHKALIAYIGNEIQIITGEYDASKARAHRFQKGIPARECEKVEIWKLVEKQSDVALALNAYSDAIRGEVDHVVIVTNDTDIVPALKLIKEHTHAKIGIIAPTKQNTVAVNQSLDDYSDWTRTHITNDELESSPLPNLIRCESSQQIIHRPISWYPRPDEFIPIFAEVKRVRGSKGAALKWLSQPCERLGGRVPLSMVLDDTELLALKAYMKQYANDHL
ncbi:MAG: NYN domain-containing protein [Candidatus Methylopumilus sp.]|nr:NYN domain-containing protein [Candidatus Methylopumilus sp.]